MAKVWYNIHMKCVKESPSIDAKLGEEILIGKIKSEGLAYITCKRLEEAVKDNFKVYYK